ncbi:ATP synthase subunit I [Bacillus fonticola]|uniref:ATP synthase subunit I n=1 Tax=Bacillus fonticola TaxID=2728853 RepID=UPI00147616F9|nr:ATP synthase subunit I [Bacillus fonticola]
MPDLNTLFKRGTKYLLYLLSIYTIGWGFTPYAPVFAGLILGTSLSLFNFWLLQRKSTQFGEAIAKGERTRSLGSFSRLATGALAVVIVLRFPDDISLGSTVIGLMTMYVVIMIDFFVLNLVSKKREKR